MQLAILNCIKEKRQSTRTIEVFGTKTINRKK